MATQRQYLICEWNECERIWERFGDFMTLKECNAKVRERKKLYPDWHYKARKTTLKELEQKA